MLNSWSLFTSTILVLTVSTGANSQEISELSHHQTPTLGQQITDYTGTIVSPDGSGLPTGMGTVSAGKQLYEAQCAACHGIDGELPGNRLAGGIGSLTSSRPLKTVGSFWPYATTLYDYTARAMPYNLEKTLTANEVYAVTAYILHLNGILGNDASLNQESLPAVVMPNQQGFIELID
jgi:cytochrome c